MNKAKVFNFETMDAEELLDTEEWEVHFPKKDKRTLYWIVLKTGDVRCQESKPKSRPFVKEEHEVLDQFDQDIMHYLDASTGMKCDYHSRCGYDRGPRFNNLIRKMLGR